MKKVLLTGGTGFIGSNIKPYLETKCELYAPTRKELNLFDQYEVRNYIKNKGIEVVIHSANPNPVKNSLDKRETMFEDSIRIFMNLYRAEDCYEYMYTLGSGAEYDKSKDICLIREEEELRSVPYDLYGLAKYTINQIIAKSSKQCNLRVFACYGPTDHSSKFITHAIRCCMQHKDITIRQNCYFDYMYVSDLGKIIAYFIENKPSYNSYNVCTGKRVTLIQIAETVKKLMNSKSEIVMLNTGLGKEYTGSNERLISEIGDYKFMSLEDGIALQIESEEKGVIHQ